MLLRSQLGLGNDCMPRSNLKAEIQTAKSSSPFVRALDANPVVLSHLSRGCSCIQRFCGYQINTIVSLRWSKPLGSATFHKKRYAGPWESWSYSVIRKIIFALYHPSRELSFNSPLQFFYRGCAVLAVEAAGVVHQDHVLYRVPQNGIEFGCKPLLVAL